MAEAVAILAYRSALMKISQNLELTSEEWADVPHLLRKHTQKLISDGMDESEEISAALVNIVRQTAQVRRSEKRQYPSIVPDD